MTVFPGWEPPAGPHDRDPKAPGELGVFARVEDLLGEEVALLRIPPGERSGEQHDRLHAIGHELDHIFEALRRRAGRLAH
jgi:hypothetical protein